MRWLQISILLSMLSWCGIGVSAEQSAARSSEMGIKKRELNQLRRELRNSQQKLQRHRREEQSVLDRLDAISRRQAMVAQEVHMTMQDLQATQKRGETLQATYDRLSHQLSGQRQRLRQRVRQLYKLGQWPYVKLLLSAKDVAEFSRKVQYIQHLAAHDRQQIGDRLTNPNLEFTLFTDRSLSFNTATRLLLLDLQALAALERA